VTKLNGSRAIYIPPCWIHATITTHGGFLIARDGEDPKSIAVVSRFFAADLADDFDRAIERSTAYYETLKSALQGTKFVHDAIHNWQAVLDVLTTGFSPEGEGAKEALTLAKDLLKMFKEERCVKHITKYLTGHGCCWDSWETLSSESVMALENLTSKEGACQKRARTARHMKQR